MGVSQQNVRYDFLNLIKSAHTSNAGVSIIRQSPMKYVFVSLLSVGSSSIVMLFNHQNKRVGGTQLIPKFSALELTYDVRKMNISINLKDGCHKCMFIFKQTHHGSFIGKQKSGLVMEMMVGFNAHVSKPHPSCITICCTFLLCLLNNGQAALCMVSCGQATSFR